jgi:hypothetical protein
MFEMKAHTQLLENINNKVLDKPVGLRYFDNHDEHQ